jgi:hypothetical protein
MWMNRTAYPGSLALVILLSGIHPEALLAGFRVHEQEIQAELIGPTIAELDRGLKANTTAAAAFNSAGKTFQQRLASFMKARRSKMKPVQARGLERDLKSAFANLWKSHSKKFHSELGKANARAVKSAGPKASVGAINAVKIKIRQETLQPMMKGLQDGMLKELKNMVGILWVALPGSTKSKLGWAVVQLDPASRNGQIVPTRFRIGYELDRAVYPTVDRIQAAIFSNTEFVRPHVGKIIHEASSEPGSTTLSFDVVLDVPGAYHIVYGPRSGHFDPRTKSGNPASYRLSVTSDAGTVKWISYWLGDATIVRTDHNERPSQIAYVAPDIVHDDTILDLLHVPPGAREFLSVRHVW